MSKRPANGIAPAFCEKNLEGSRFAHDLGNKFHLILISATREKESGGAALLNPLLTMEGTSTF